MFEVLKNLQERNETLLYFGLVNLLLAIVLYAISTQSEVKVYNVNAYYKPIKFALSIWMYAWTMAWYCSYLKDFNTAYFNWATIILLGFEVVYIAFQAHRGQLSHYNLSTPMYSLMYSAMAVAASLITIYTAYVAVLFFGKNVVELPEYYLWSIRLGLIIFVIFSFEGFVMGARLTHSIGGADGSPGMPFLGWSYSLGDPRVAHFIGMHSLQVLPILSYFILKNTKLTIGVSIIYGLLALWTLIQALQGKPLIK